MLIEEVSESEDEGGTTPASEKTITSLLSDQSHIENTLSLELRHQALELVKSIEVSTSDLSKLPETLLALLTQIIKPLFSKSTTTKLTSTGRKKLGTNTSLPDSITRFSDGSLWGDDDHRPLWKNGWTPTLLIYILRSYHEISDQALRKKTLEDQFYLLIPAILHQLDDAEIQYKCDGCRCLQSLCEILRDAQSMILKRSGLTDVFIDALKNDFSLFPTLTPEEESLQLYQTLYPAYRALVQARFHVVKQENHVGGLEEDSRQKYLTLLLRHSLLHSLSHLFTGSGLGSTTSVKLSTFFISQLSWLISDIGLAFVVHLQYILPLLRNVLMDPFGTTSPELLLFSVKACQKVVEVCRPRIKERWWGEVLRGVVGCWVNVVDEMGDLKDTKIRHGLEDVMKELKMLAHLLEDVVGEDFADAKRVLLVEEPELQGLFDGNLSKTKTTEQNKIPPTGIRSSNASESPLPEL